MRVASRVIGVGLAVAGLGFFALGLLLTTGTLDKRSVLDSRGPETAEWIAGGVVMALGLGLLPTGWYYFRLDPAEIDKKDAVPRSYLSVQLVHHRRGLKALALAGLLVSTVRLLQLCLGANWPGNWGTTALSYLSIVLVFASVPIQDNRANGRLNWILAPKTLRPVLRIASYAAVPTISAWIALLAWRQWRHEAPSPVLQAVFPIILFTWAGLIFAYGQADSELAN